MGMPIQHVLQRVALPCKSTCTCDHGKKLSGKLAYKNGKVFSTSVFARKLVFPTVAPTVPP